MKTDGTWETVVPQNGKNFELDELNKFVGGYIEIITLKGSRFMVLNEEGKLDGLPFNQRATMVFRESFPGTNDFIVGNVLVCPNDMIE